MDSVAVIWVAMCGLVAYFSNTRGRNAALWFCLSLLISPLLAGIILILIPDESLRQQQELAERARRIRNQKRERDEQRVEKEEKRRDEDERRRDREQSQQLHAVLLNKLSPPQISEPVYILPSRGVPPPLPTISKGNRPPPLPGEVVETGWYAAIDGEKCGPLDLQQLAKLVLDGRINNETLIWRDGYTSWTSLKAEPALVKAIRSSATAIYKKEK